MTSVYIFFSVHELLFDRIARRLRAEYGVSRFSGFVWGLDQKHVLDASPVHYDPLLVFSRDVLTKAFESDLDLQYLESREKKYGVSIHRMLASERHLVRYGYDRLLRITEQLFRKIETTLEESRPDLIFSEAVSCLTSYIHMVVARQLGIPFYAAGSARIENLIYLGRADQNVWAQTFELFDRVHTRSLTAAEENAARAFVDEFRKKPTRAPYMQRKAKLSRGLFGDLALLRLIVQRRWRERNNPTMGGLFAALRQRLTRVVRVLRLKAANIFESPRDNERFVLYPIHFQPEASTLVQAPYYLDQESLIEDIAKSLPIGYRLYVKEHFANRGRRPLSFYRRIAAIPGVRLLSEHEDSFSLLRRASAIAVITGSMGWEGLLFQKPVITFGDVYYNHLPFVYRAHEVPKDEWFSVFQKAMHEHRHDERLLLAFVSAILQTTFPGVVKNAQTFPHVLDDQNIDNVARALASVAQLTSANHSEKASAAT